MNIGLVVRPRQDAAMMEAIREEVEALREAGHTVWPRLTFEEGDGARLGRELARAGSDLVIAAGGDGTVNEVVNGVLADDWEGRLGILPLGTANDFAAGLGLPEGVPESFEVAVSGEERRVDVATLNDRRFVNASTAGFGATASEETSSETKKLLGPWAYLVTGIREFVELRPSHARFTTPEGEAFDGEVLMFAVGNGTRTGGGTVLTPRAELDDGRLDVLIVPGMSRMDFVALLPDLRAGNHADHPELRYLQTERLDVETEDELSVNVDGQATSDDRFRYAITPGVLRIMAP